jgi:hypothetical protein
MSSRSFNEARQEGVEFNLNLYYFMDFDNGRLRLKKGQAE